MKQIRAEFEQIYRTFYAQLCRTAYHLINDRDAAHDVVQEVFYSLCAQPERLDDIENIKAFLNRAVINASLNHIRSRKKFTDELPDVPSADHSGSDRMEASEMEQNIAKVLNNLPSQCRTIFMLSRFEGMKYREIADEMGLSIKTVENQMGIALKKIRSGLQSYYPGNVPTTLLMMFSLLQNFFM